MRNYLLFIYFNHTHILTPFFTCLYLFFPYCITYHIYYFFSFLPVSLFPPKVYAPAMGVEKKIFFCISIYWCHWYPNEGNNGTIDGQGSIWWNNFWNKTLNYTRPHLVELMNSTGVLISNVTFLNSPFWTIHPVYCRFVPLRRIEFIHTYLLNFMHLNYHFKIMQ